MQSAILYVLEQNKTSISHNAIISHAGASFWVQNARRRRTSLPRDALDYRVLVEFADDQGAPGWTAEVCVALRQGRIWNPAAHLRVGRLWADDTDDVQVIAERMEEWGRSL